MSVDYDVKTTGDGLFHWRTRYELWANILARSYSLKLKCVNGGFVSYKAFHFTKC